MSALSYELAKDLKAAGWPQPWMQGPAYTPSLSEIIAACPLTYCHDGMDIPFRLTPEKRGETVVWHAGYVVIDGEGATPEEAVARLWLALQDKA